MGEKRSVQDAYPSLEKIQKLLDQDEKEKDEDLPPIMINEENVLAQFCSEEGETAGPPIELPRLLTRGKLQHLLNALLDQDENLPYTFFIDDREITGVLDDAINKIFVTQEKMLRIIYQPQAVFKVRAVERCSSSIPGHAEAILHVSFSPCGQYLASGSGDTTVRFWDIKTETPHRVCEGHKHWVLMTSWSPDGERLASACKAGQIFIWDPKTGKQMGKALSGHKRWITALSWEPMHLCVENVCRRLASAGKDGDIRIWDIKLGISQKTLAGHLKCVTALRWGGEGLIYSGSQDRTIKIWNPNEGTMLQTLQGHAHWVNTLALNTDYVLRTGPQNPKDLMKPCPEIVPEHTRKESAKKRYDDVLSICKVERLVSGSDDFTLFLWEPTKSKKPIARLVGHLQLVNDVKFSPDTRYFASASFDKSIRLWNGMNGKLITVFRGHVLGVYQLAWAADSRLLLSGSRDSTVKVWNVIDKTLENDLPGHGDEVYAVDWSPDGSLAVSGGKDKILKVWR